MECERCAEFDTEIEIHSPSLFRRIATKVRGAVDAGTLSYSSFESSRALIGQPSFLGLDVEGQLPDVMRYHFNCPACGKCFGLFVEAYHGSGGKWSVLGTLPANYSLKRTAAGRLR